LNNDWKERNLQIEGKKKTLEKNSWSGVNL